MYRWKKNKTLSLSLDTRSTLKFNFGEVSATKIKTIKKSLNNVH